MRISRRLWFLGVAFVPLLALAACGGDGDGGADGLDTNYPSAGEDRFDESRATVEIELTLPGVGALPVALGGRETIELVGPTVVERSDPGDADGDGLVDIQTEIVSMELTGVGSMGPITVRLNPDQRSMGQVEQQEPGQDTPADSFFDIWIEVEVGDLGLIGITEEPIRMEAELVEFPPGFLDQYEGALALPTPLLSADSKEEFALILDALHIPNPPPPPPPPGGGETPEATPTEQPTVAPTEPPPAAGLSGTRQCDVEVRTDVAGHAEFVGMPPVIELDFQQTDSTIDINGPPPWVSLHGDIQDGVTIFAGGMGEVAGFPDIQVDYQGFVKGDTVDGVLTMGGGGGLPQGQPINYQVTCP